MILSFILVKLIEIRKKIKRVLSCFTVVAENMDDIIDIGEDFDKPSNSSSVESLSSY